MEMLVAATSWPSRSTWRLPSAAGIADDQNPNETLAAAG